MQVQNLKFTLINKLISVNDVDLLNKINDLISSVDINKSVFIVSEKQNTMLAQSEDDIAQGRLISNETLNLVEDKWLKCSLDKYSPKSKAGYS